MENWKEIWERKGNDVGSLRDMDGYENTEADMELIAKSITEILDIKPTDKILEVGCGAGAIAQYLNCDYVGIDYSTSLVKSHIKTLNNSVLVSEANDLPFKDKTFNKVFSFGVFLYFPNHAYAFESMKEMLRVSRGDIFIGEIPMRSHRKSHLLYNKEQFFGKISEGFCDPYKKDRFNVKLKNGIF